MKVEIWVALDKDDKMVSYARFLKTLDFLLHTNDDGLSIGIDSVVKIVRQEIKIPFKPLNELPF